MKYYTVCLFVLLAICAYSVSAQSHNVTFGVVHPYDTVLDRQIIVKKSKWLQIVTEDFQYPKKGNVNYRNITAIRCTDQYSNGTGGYATLLSGGVGYRNVTIHLKSQRSHGFNFIVEIFGR